MTQIFLPLHLAWTFARLPDLLVEYRVPTGAVLHVGAHHGEEVDIYRRCGYTCIVLVEPDPDSVAVLRERFDADDTIEVIAAAAVVAPTGPAHLYRAQRSVWSGLHPHPTATGEAVTVPTVRLAYLLADDTSTLVLDTQGSELDLLRAADLDRLHLVIVETTRRPGDGAAFYPDAVRHMARQRWRVVEEWVHDSSGYTDTVFIPETRRR